MRFFFSCEVHGYFLFHICRYSGQTRFKSVGISHPPFDATTRFSGSFTSTHDLVRRTNNDHSRHILRAGARAGALQDSTYRHQGKRCSDAVCEYMICLVVRMVIVTSIFIMYVLGKKCTIDFVAVADLLFRSGA